MDILEQIDEYLELNEAKMLDTGTAAEKRERKAAAMVDVDAWAKQKNIKFTRTLPRIPGGTYAAGLTKKELAKMGIKDHAEEAAYWKEVQQNLLYHKKKFAAGQVGTMWKSKQKYKDIVRLQKYVSNRERALKDMIAKKKKK